MGKMVWKILGMGSAAVAAGLATRLVDRIWRGAGQDTTLDPKNPETPLVKALSYVTISGLAAGTARTLATRRAAAYYARSAGHLPKELTDTDDDTDTDA
jgi:hypothetical protein